MSTHTQFAGDPFTLDLRSRTGVVSPSNTSVSQDPGGFLRVGPFKRPHPWGLDRFEN